jgi:hypothetical protein
MAKAGATPISKAMAVVVTKRVMVLLLKGCIEETRRLQKGFQQSELPG